MFERATLLFRHFLKLWYEKRRNNELTRSCEEPWYENSINVIKKQLNWDNIKRGFAVLSQSFRFVLTKYGVLNTEHDLSRSTP
jgi:hypothetical protein